MEQDEYLVETGIWVPSDYESDEEKQNGDEPMELDDEKPRTVLESKKSEELQHASSSSGMQHIAINPNKRKITPGSNVSIFK